jgi:hypothetical protein
VTVAVATLVDVPFAAMDAGDNDRPTLVACPAVCVRVACPEMFGDTEPSVAVTVTGCAVVELVIVAV